MLDKVKQLGVDTTIEVLGKNRLHINSKLQAMCPRITNKSHTQIKDTNNVLKIPSTTLNQVIKLSTFSKALKGREHKR
jgi:hypothetical protein